MTNAKPLLPLALTVLLAFAGCRGSTEKTAPGVAQNDSYVVVASISTIADFVEKISGGSVEVITLVPAGAEPHDWEPSAKDIARLETADMLVLSGAGFEHWVDAVVPSLNNTLKVVDTSWGIELLEERDHDVNDGHNHEADPHIWLAPENAKKQMENIRDALVGIDPDSENAQRYNARYDQWAGELDKLDEEYRDALSPLTNKDIVVAHEAFGYLCRAYGLHQVAVQGLSPEGEPEPGQMAAVVEYARENTVKVIFFEEAASPKVAEAIAREVGAETAVLNPLEGLTQEQLDAGEDYFSIMRRNLDALKAALS